MRPTEKPRAEHLEALLREFSGEVRPLPGIVGAKERATLVRQLVDSRRRIEFVHTIKAAKLDIRRADPDNDLFDPLKAAVIAHRTGDMDEAFWLVFLATHFGKHAVDGWRLTRDVYGRLGEGRWDWVSVSRDVAAFRRWLNEHQSALKEPPRRGRFSNHRKYESLSAISPKGTGAVIESYVAWVAPPRTHMDLVREAHLQVGQHPQETFRWLYASMGAVKRFGRLGKFDYLTMLGKLDIAPIEPDSAYLAEATGPLSGARLLFDGHSHSKTNPKTLDQWLMELDERLDVGMQTLEDALCNWQKSPSSYRYFRG